MTNPILKILFLNLFIFLPLSACKAEEVQTLQSLPFLAVDLNGNGKIDTIPLEKSEVYFDVDGDGLAERTEWISPEDGIISYFTREQDAALKTIKERILVFNTGGLAKFQSLDRTQDSKYDNADIIEPTGGIKYWPATVFIWSDVNSNGYSDRLEQGKFSKNCDWKAFNFQENTIQNMAYSGFVECKDGTQFFFKEMFFDFEDSNIEIELPPQNNAQ